MAEKADNGKTSVIEFAKQNNIAIEQIVSQLVAAGIAKPNMKPEEMLLSPDQLSALLAFLTGNQNQANETTPEPKKQ